MTTAISSPDPQSTADPQFALAKAQAKLAADQAAKAAQDIIAADQLAVAQAAKAETQSTGLVDITV
jgi:hypothetical protein